MTVRELNREQIIQLKQAYLCEEFDERGLTPSWGELAEVDTTISDEVLFERYEDYDFVEEDFISSIKEDM